MKFYIANVLNSFCTHFRKALHRLKTGSLKERLKETLDTTQENNKVEYMPFPSSGSNGGFRGLQPSVSESSHAAEYLRTLISLLLNAASVCAVAYAIHYIVTPSLFRRAGEGLVYCLSRPVGLCFCAARKIISLREVRAHATLFYSVN